MNKIERVGASATLLDFLFGVRMEDLPPDVVERTRMGILDTLAATIAGVRGEGVQELSGLVSEWGGRGEATPVTTGRKLPVPLATLINGVAGRAWDLDDVHEQNTCHSSVNIVAPALALAESRGPVSGRVFVAAVAAGCELICRLSSAPLLSFSTTGASMSYQCGYLGAALTSAKLLALDTDQCANALGIAYACLAGNQQGYLEGAMTVRLMQGIAAEGGVVSALMAERGLTGARDIIEGRFGYYNTFHRGQFSKEALVDGLGDEWRLNDVSIKPLYPCCKYTHGPIEATAEAMRKAGATHEDIQSINVTVTNREVFDLVCETRDRKWNPATVVDAQFSLPFTVSHAAVHGTVSLDTFQPSGLGDELVRAMLPKVSAHLDLDSQGDRRGTFPMPGDVEIVLKSGQAVRERVVYVRGHPKKPMDFGQVAEKFRACADFSGMSADRANEVIEAVGSITDLKDSGVIGSLLAHG